MTPVADDLVGVAVLGPAGTGFDEALDALPTLTARLRGAPAVTELRGAGPLRQTARSVRKGRILLVGDAAGYVDALTGEGLSTGFTAAHEAVAAVADGRPEGYPRAWARGTRRHRWLTGALLGLTAEGWPAGAAGAGRGPAAAGLRRGGRPAGVTLRDLEKRPTVVRPATARKLSAIHGKLGGCVALAGSGARRLSSPRLVFRRVLTARARRTRRPPLVREVALVASLFLAYRLGRLAITGHDQLAVTNAWWVWDVERTLRLPDEELFQQWALQWPDLLRAANWYYVGVHFPLTAAFLIWGWLRRPPEEYRYARRLLSLLTGLALIVHVVMPLAPPRMLSSLGFLDTMAVFGPSAYGDSSATIANQFAAMPSLHVGWALLIAIVVVQTAHSRWRWIAVFHPLLTVMVVVATANHYWVDAIAAALLLLVAIVVVPQPYGPSFLSRWWGAWRDRSSARPPALAGAEGSGSARRAAGLDAGGFDSAGHDGGGLDDHGSDYQPARGSVTSGRELSSASSGSAVSSSSGDCPPRPRPPSE